jgi:hypothetical protein
MPRTQPNAGLVINPDGKYMEVLPPISAKNTVHVIKDIATFFTEHYVSNHKSKDLSEAAYTFPVPNGYALVHFDCEFNSYAGTQRRVKTVVKPLPRAIAQVAHEVAKGR